jgi:hypothetical protein
MFFYTVCKKTLSFYLHIILPAIRQLSKWGEAILLANKRKRKFHQLRIFILKIYKRKKFPETTSAEENRYYQF